MRVQLGAGGHGLRLRVAVTFALGGLALSVTLAVLTYAVADRYLTDQRERSATRQAYVFARFAREELRRGASDEAALAALEVPAGGGVLLHRGGQWSSTDPKLGEDDVPPSLRRVAAGGAPASQRLALGGDPVLVVALPVAEIRADFFMVFPLTELSKTLGVLRDTLLGAAVGTTIAAAFVGALSARRVLQPLSDVGAAARSIASGDLTARLDVGDDPDLRILTESFNAMAHALQVRIERDARFASDVSHELRSPLMTLASAVSVLERRAHELAPRDQEALRLLAEEVGRFDRLVQDLLELARAESGSEAAYLEMTRIDELIRHSLEASGIVRDSIEVDISLRDSGIVTDKRRLDRIMTNLIVNAEVHGGGVVRVGVEERNGAVHIEVDDRGPGIPPALRAHVFERFFRGAASGRRGDDGGTGLGLALVSEHVRLLAGRVWIEDGPGGTGARFIVEVPRGAS